MTLPPDWLEQLKAAYPRRDGPHWWLNVRTILPQSVSAGATWEEIVTGTKGYAAYCDRQGFTGTSFVKPAKNFFDYRTQGWTEDYSIPEKPKSPADYAKEARWAALRARSKAIGFRDPLAVESPDVYETALRLAERERLESRGSQRSPIARDIPNVVSMLARAKAV